MRKIRYSVVMSLDGYIAGPNGEADWIVMNPEIDFAEVFRQFDTLLIGRKTYEFMAQAGRTEVPGMNVYVFSRSMQAKDCLRATLVREDAEKTVESVRRKKGKDIWLFGGGTLFRSLLAARLVDTVEVGIIPVLLGNGIPMLPAPADQAKLKLIEHKIYKTGTVSLRYAVTERSA